MNYILGDACQNTFVLFDRLEDSSLDQDFLHHVHSCLIAENKDDALILYDGEKGAGVYFSRMLVLGADRQIAEFCGNGARVCAAYLYGSYPSCSTIFLNGYPLKRHDCDIYSIKLPSASFTWNSKFITDPQSLEKGIYVDMLEPHLILQEDLSDKELFTLGRELNQRKDLFPHGINVNAWKVLEKDHLFVKTYERGVQRLTLSCGTGSISCASFYKKQGAVQVSTPGGPLEILLQEDGTELKGPASFLYRDKIAK